MTQSLKANKAKQHSPSKVEVILSDKQKLAYAPMVALCAKAYGYELESENLTQLKGKANFEFAMNFVNIVKDNKLDYPNYIALKKHTIQSIASAKHIQYDSVEKWFNPIIKSYIKNDLANGYELPKAESKSAKGMASLRAELSALSDSDITAQIAELAKQGASGDKEALKRATQLASEKQKRDKQAENAIKKADSKATTELKGALKRWITGLEGEQLAALLWAKNHFNEVTKLAKQAK